MLHRHRPSIRRSRAALFAALLLAAGVAAVEARAPSTPPLGAPVDSLRVVNRAATVVDGEGTPHIHLDARPGDGIAWLDGASLGTGVIELDVRGKDVQGRSFVGVAFGASNDSTYEAVYLRPFNFHATDSTAHAHAIQYVAEPTHHWDRLRREEPGRFEQPIDPAPEPNGWVHLRVVVGTDSVAVYVEGETEPSLAVRRKTPGAAGAVGYWAGHESDGDFRGLRVAVREPR